MHYVSLGAFLAFYVFETIKTNFILLDPILTLRGKPLLLLQWFYSGHSGFYPLYPLGKVVTESRHHLKGNRDEYLKKLHTTLRVFLKPKKKNFVSKHTGSWPTLLWRRRFRRVGLGILDQKQTPDLFCESRIIPMLETKNCSTRSN